MKNRSVYQEISRLYRRFQFHVSGFVLAAAGIWIFLGNIKGAIHSGLAVVSARGLGCRAGY